MARVTFSLDDETVAQIRRTAARLRRPQSHVVGDAVAVDHLPRGRFGSV